jgi:PTH2 family peptidyl-tRNA hydrolase
MKQVILIRQDLKMPKGKLAAQASHASVDAVLNSDKIKIERWKNQGGKKLILKVKDINELKKYFNRAKKEKLVTVIIKDAAKTFFKKSVVTCIAIGPDEDSKIDSITKELSLL